MHRARKASALLASGNARLTKVLASSGCANAHLGALAKNPVLACDLRWTGFAAARRLAPMSLPPFHLAFPVDDLAAARAFYGGLMGCPEGRSDTHWIDFDLHGHQIVAHLAPEAAPHRALNLVDGEDVPV